MNYKEWNTLRSTSKSLLNFNFYNKTRSIQKTLNYNSDPKAVVIHHLRDTEEQRKYNDEHYELFGFEIDENGSEHFEYGKYVIFVTKKEHAEIHKCSEETINKKRIANLGHVVSEETKNKISIANSGKTWSDERKEEWSVKNSGSRNHFYGKHHSIETKENHFIGEKNPMYGKHHTDEAKQRISEANKNKIVSQETRDKLSKSSSGENNGMYGKCHTEESVYKMQHSSGVELQRRASAAYKEYKSSGGDMKWQDFRREFFKENREEFVE